MMFVTTTKMSSTNASGLLLFHRYSKLSPKGCKPMPTLLLYSTIVEYDSLVV